MTSIDDLEPKERKRQREALRRRLAGPGLRPGLLQKWQNTTTAAGKWAFMQAFLLDPQNLSGVQIETEYSDLAEQQDASCWAELPLSALKKLYTTEAEKLFLEESIVKKQTGRAHPQAPENPDMTLYWVYRENTETSKNTRGIATKVTARGTLPMNRAAGQAVTDGINNFAASFGGKGSSSLSTPSIGGGGKGADPKPKTEPKPKKARLMI